MEALALADNAPFSLSHINANPMFQSCFPLMVGIIVMSIFNVKSVGMSNDCSLWSLGFRSLLCLNELATGV